MAGSARSTEIQQGWERLAAHLHSVVGERINELFGLLEEATPPGSGQRYEPHPEALGPELLGRTERVI